MSGTGYVVFLNGSGLVIDLPAEPVPEHSDLTCVAYPADGAVELGWVTGDGGKTFADPLAATLAHHQADRVAALRRACTDAISAGFTSNALGAPHRYGSGTAHDQGNLRDVAACGGDLMCAPDSGAWSLATHTAEQGQRVLRDFVAFRDPLRARCADLVAQVQATTTTAAVEAVAW